MSVNGNISAGGEIRGTVSGHAPIRGSTGGMKVLHTDSYAIAVANGFVGTVDEWLESLKGPKGDTGPAGADGISPVVAVEDIDGGHRVTITDKNSAKQFDVMDGTVTEEQIASAVEDYMAEHPVEVTDIVKTVNGISPDENGNVEIPVSGGNVDLTGYATEQYVKDYAQPKGNYLTAIPDGYAKTEDIPTKPEDIGAQPAGNYALKTDIPSVPVRSVNGKIGAVSLSASDVGARPSNWMPTAQEVGALPDTYVPPNQTAAQVGADPAGTAAAAVSAHNTSTDSHWDLRLELKVINDRLTAFFDSDNQTLDELSEIVAYITSNKALIDSITTSKVSVADIINNLTTNVANKPLSAAQGVALKGLIDSVSNSLRNYQPKGDYALRSELPTVPTKVSQLENDTGYLTKHQDISGKLDADKLPEAVNTALAQAKESGEFDGEDGQRGTGLLAVTTAPASYTTAVGGITPKYRMAISTIKTQAGVTEVLLGDTVRYSYYHYPIDYLDSSYAYFTERVSIRGATGADGKTPVKGTDYFTAADKAEMVNAVIAALPVYNGEVL